MHTLTNAHTHLELSALRHLCPARPAGFLTWMFRVAWARRQSSAVVAAAIQAGIDELKACGTTHVADITATWQSVEPLLDSGLSGVVYLEVLSPARRVAMTRLTEAQARIRHYGRSTDGRAMRVGLSVHAPYTCHPDLFRAAARWCREENVPLCVHAAESPIELELFAQARISAAALPVHVVTALCGIRKATRSQRSPIAYLDALGVLDARPLLVHAVQVDERDIALIAAKQARVVHCPRSNHLLGCGRMPLEEYLAAGVDVYLGTDSLASCPSLAIGDEVRFAQEVHRGRIPGGVIDALARKPFCG